MRILLLSILFVLISFIAACSRKPGILRSTSPSGNIYSDIKYDTCSIVRTKYFDLSLQPVDEAGWKKFSKYKPFFSKGKGTAGQRSPKMIFFHSIIINTSVQAFSLNNIDFILSYDEKKTAPLSSKDIEKKLKSPAYSVFNFKKILTPKRLLEEKYCINDIDYADDIIDYSLNFIQPGERIILILAFDPLPVECRNFTITMLYKKREYEKSIDFDYTRLEYRRKGKHFIKENKKERDINK